MRSSQKAGGVAAVVDAAAFVVGFVVAAALIAPEGYDVADVDDPVGSAGFLADNQAVMYVWNLIIYVVFGLFLVVLVLALYDRLKAAEPLIARAAAAVGLIWAGLVIAAGMVANVGMGSVVDLLDKDPAQAGSLWLALASVENGLGGGNEIAGGVWVLLVSWAALRADALPRALNYLGVAIGLAGLLTIVPALEAFGALFGLGLIVWFIWVGSIMLKGAADGDSISEPMSSG